MQNRGEGCSNEEREVAILVQHVPRIVVNRYVQNPVPISQPEITTFTAVIALFDLSGFSSLSNKLREIEKNHIKSLQSPFSLNHNPNNPTDMENCRPLFNKDLPMSSTLNSRSNNSLSASQNSPSKHRLSDIITGRRQRNLSNTSMRSLRSERISSSIWSDNENVGEANKDKPSDRMKERRQSLTEQQNGCGKSSPTRSINFFGHSKPTAPQGEAVEILTQTLNNTLQPVIDVILRFGGDIIKFAGDAMVVLWETEASRNVVTPPGILICNAVKCALDSLKVVDQYALIQSSTSHSLGMHVGIGISEVTGNHVGGELGRWEFYVAGDANRQMSEAEAEASQGEVSISKEAYKALMDCCQEFAVSCQVIPTPKSNYIVTSISDFVHKKQVTSIKPRHNVAQCLRAYLPGPIISSIAQGITIAPCVRNVTVVFVKLSGVLEIEDAVQQSNHVHKLLLIIQQAAYKVQGTLRQFVIDDKGAIAIVIIGLPPFYHENNAFRGVKLACFLSERGVIGSFGVTTGAAYCGSIGSDIRAEYAVVGDVVNLSARLMTAASTGEILCDNETYNNSMDMINYQKPREMVVKGQSQPVIVHAVDKNSNSTLLDSLSLQEKGVQPYGCDEILKSIPLVGRDSKKQSQHHRVLIISGSSGTGKTMLLRHVYFHNKHCYMGRGDPIDSSTEFHAWISILREIGKTNVQSSTRLTTTKPRSSTTSSISHLQNSNVSGRSEVDGSVNVIEYTGLVNDNACTLEEPSEDISSDRLQLPVLQYALHKRIVTEEMTQALRDLIGGDGDQSSYTKSNNGLDKRAKLLSTAIFKLIAIVSSKKPLVFMFDNAQWVDTRSWTLLAKILQELPNVNAVIAIRESCHLLKHPVFDILQNLPYSKKMSLTAFTYQQASMFLCQCYNIAIMDTQVLDFVFNRTDGNPKELIQLVEFMIENNYIKVDTISGHILILADLDELDTQVPQQIRAAVLSCIDNFNAIAQLAMKVICVHPYPAQEALLYTLIEKLLSNNSNNVENSVMRCPGNSNSSVLSARQISMTIQRELTASLAKEVITFDSRCSMYYYNSEEMRLVVYDSMLPSQRKAIHEAYVAWFKDIILQAQEITVRKKLFTNSRAVTPPKGNDNYPSIFLCRGLSKGNISIGTYPLLRRQTDLVQLRNQPPSSIFSTAFSSSERNVGNNSGLQMLQNPAHSPTNDSFARSSRSLLTRQNTSKRQNFIIYYQQHAMLAYHLSRSGHAKAALNAYQMAAELATMHCDLTFANDCMQSSAKIIQDDGNGIREQRDYILLRSKIAFVRGVIAVEKCDWSTAISLFTYIIRVCERQSQKLRQETIELKSNATSHGSNECVSMSRQHPSSVMPHPLQLSTAEKSGALGIASNSFTKRSGPSFRFRKNTWDLSSVFHKLLKVPLKIYTKLNVRSRKVCPELRQIISVINEMKFYQMKASYLIQDITRLQQQHETLNTNVQSHAQLSLAKSTSRARRMST